MPGGPEPGAAHEIFCQQALGSLWLVTRTRPDMAWAFSIPANKTTRRPKVGVARAGHVLANLISARELGLMYVGGSGCPFRSNTSHDERACFLEGSSAMWNARGQFIVAPELVEAVDDRSHRDTSGFVAC